jgi:phosphatidylinositol phospholipase C delta
MIVPLEYIKELRTGPEARYYREQFGVSYTHESCWMSIVYMYDGEYKTLHLLATTKDLFRLWEDSIRKLMAVRKEMLMGLSDGAVREEVWARQHWADADSEDRDERLAFDEVEKMCRKMNVNASKDKLKSLFTVRIDHFIWDAMCRVC